MQTVVEPQQPHDVIQAEAQSLGRLYESHATHVDGAVATDAAVAPQRLGQQVPALVEADGLNRNAGGLGQAPYRQLPARVIHGLESVPEYGPKLTPMLNRTIPSEQPRPAGRGALLTGGLAAILASTCCAGPLVLLALGFSGAWIGNLTLLEPYRPAFIAVAVTALFFAGLRIFRPAAECPPGDVCAVPRVRTIYRILFWGVATLLLISLVFPYLAPLFY